MPYKSLARESNRIYSESAHGHTDVWSGCKTRLRQRGRCRKKTKSVFILQARVLPRLSVVLSSGVSFPWLSYV